MAALFPKLHARPPTPAVDWKFPARDFTAPAVQPVAGVAGREDICMNCGAVDSLESEEMITCKGCGLIVERPLDLSAEYRFFGSEDRSGSDPCRVGAPTDARFADSSLGTIIIGFGHGGHASARGAMMRVRRFHTWNMFPYKKRSLLGVFEQMTLAATNHGLDQRVIETAKDLYVQLVEHCDRRGLSRASVVASCIYSALKMIGQPRKPKEIADIFHLQNAQFTKAFKHFQCVLAMAKQKGILKGMQTTPSELHTTRATDYIKHPLSKLQITRAEYPLVCSTAMTVAEKVEELELSRENMPPSLASGCLAWTLAHMGYDSIPIAQIAAACEVSEGTLVKCLRRIEAAENDLLALIPSSKSNVKHR
jgi:transcription initiation factor TFIIIB Brf1 subunit/transcription initiation factor TFIIB